MTFLFHDGTGRHIKIITTGRDGFFFCSKGRDGYFFIARRDGAGCFFFDGMGRSIIFLTTGRTVLLFFSTGRDGTFLFSRRDGSVRFFFHCTGERKARTQLLSAPKQQCYKLYVRRIMLYDIIHTVGVNY